MTPSLDENDSQDGGIVAEARRRLAESNLRATQQRLLVLAAVMRERNDVTAQRLHEQLRAQEPALGLATVYRTLNSLHEHGIVDALSHGTSTCYRYCGPEHHHHLTCRSCHTVVELRDCGLHDWAAARGAAHGFSGVEHTLELTGLCRSCSAAGS